MTVQGYDLVGDIHGHADALNRLLRELDYAEIEGIFRHPERQIIFVGDLSIAARSRGKFCELPAPCAKPAQQWP